MTESESSNLDYTLGFSEEFLDALMLRTAAANAAYLLPRLEPGMRVLDVGCGTGSISVGMAQAVAPGEVYGIDIEESQVNLARAVASRHRQENVVFQAADATSLPFEGCFFDVVHCHDILMHIPDTQATLAEAKRVLKPGGILGCREMISESCFSYPDFGILRRAWDMFEDVVATGNGHPQMGKELKTHLDAAGFANARITATFDMFATPKEILFIHAIADQWFLSPEMREMAIGFGASTDDLAGDIEEAYNRWKDHPGALCGLAFGEAVAVRP